MYEELKRRLQEIIDREPVDTINACTISAYDLIEAVNEELKEIRETLNSNRNVERINQSYKITNVLSRKISKLFRRTEESAIKMPTLESINFDCDKEHSSVLFTFAGNSSKEKYLRIYKGFKDEAIYFGRDDVPYNNQRIFVRDNSDYIKNTFQILESFVEKYEVTFSNNSLRFNSNEEAKTQSYTDEFLDIKFYIDNFTLIPKINLVDGNLNRMFCAEWLNRERLDYFVVRNNEKFLRNVQIPIEELKPLYRKLIDSYNSKKEQKQKVLEK